VFKFRRLTIIMKWY